MKKKYILSAYEIYLGLALASIAGSAAQSAVKVIEKKTEFYRLKKFKKENLEALEYEMAMHNASVYFGLIPATKEAIEKIIVDNQFLNIVYDNL